MFIYSRLTPFLKEPQQESEETWEKTISLSQQYLPELQDSQVLLQILI